MSLRSNSSNNNLEKSQLANEGRRKKKKGREKGQGWKLGDERRGQRRPSIQALTFPRKRGQKNSDSSAAQDATQQQNSANCRQPQKSEQDLGEQRGRAILFPRIRPVFLVRRQQFHAAPTFFKRR